MHKTNHSKMAHNFTKSGCLCVLLLLSVLFSSIFSGREYFQSQLQLGYFRPTTQTKLKIGIVVVSHFDVVQRDAGRYNAWGCYAARHGYHYHIDLVQPVKSRAYIYNNKIIAISKYLPYYDYLLYVDSDISIESMNTTIESYVENSNASLFLTDDPHRINAGALLFKNSQWTHTFLQSWINLQGYAFDDNGALWNNILLSAFPDYDNRCGSIKVKKHMDLLSSCYNNELDSRGYVYGKRELPHIFLISRHSKLRGLHFFEKFPRRKKEYLFQDGDFLKHSNTQSIFSSLSTVCGPNQPELTYSEIPAAAFRNNDSSK